LEDFRSLRVINLLFADAHVIAATARITHDRETTAGRAGIGVTTPTDGSLPPTGLTICVLRYVTTNSGKVREAREYLDNGSVDQLEFDYTEVQAPTLEPIAARGAREAYRHADGPVLVDDAGLFVDGLDGFPGPYSAYVEETLGTERVGELARRTGTTPRDEATGPARAAFRCVLAYCDGDPFDASPDPVDRGDRVAAAAANDENGAAGGLPVKLFEGVVRGRIVEPRGNGGFGYDPIFEHDGTTLAEMNAEEKNAISHRGRALAKFAEWYATR
jgi:XTP/dITP diphosphohydrolase